METYNGACHCRNIRFEVTLDLSEPVIECNCSHCQMKGLLLQFVPADRVTLVQGSEDTTEYLFNTHTIQHLFCSDCGVQPFGRGKDKEGNEVVAINVRCIDGADFAAFNRVPFDGRSA